jgi:hypothetical protein
MGLSAYLSTGSQVCNLLIGRGLAGGSTIIGATLAWSLSGVLDRPPQGTQGFTGRALPFPVFLCEPCG